MNREERRRAARAGGSKRRGLVEGIREADEKEQFALLDGLFRSPILVTFSDGNTERMYIGEFKNNVDEYIAEAREGKPYPVKVEALESGLYYGKTGLAIAEGSLLRIQDKLQEGA